MKATDFTVKQMVNYTNGNLSIYEGMIVEIKNDSLIVVGSEDGYNLWLAGYAVGSEISFNQLVK